MLFAKQLLLRGSVLLLFAAATFGISRGVIGAVYPLNAKYWDGSNDFQWSPSRVLLSGTDPYALYQQLGRANNAGLDAPFILSQWADYPPSSLMILWPLAAMPWHVAKWCWVGINLLSVAAILWCCLRLLRMTQTSAHAVRQKQQAGSAWLQPSNYGWLALLFLACPSISSTLKSGQHGLFSIAAFLLSVVVWKSQESSARRTTFAGVLLALSWLKYTMTLPLSLFFLVRERKPVFCLAVSLHLLATLFAAGWTGTSPVELLRGNLEVASGNLGLVAFDLSQLVSRVGLEGYVLIASLLSGMVLVAVQQSTDEDDLETLSMLGFLSFLLLPHLRYDLYMLVIPLTFALAKPKQRLVSGLILISVIQLWFVRETIETVIGQNPADERLQSLAHLTVGVSVFLLYAPMILSWMRLMPRLEKVFVPMAASGQEMAE